MDDASRRAQLERNWKDLANGRQATHDIYHDDAVLEFPQSGERFVGLQNFREWRNRYPVDVEFQVRRMRGRGDVWITEVAVSYDDGPWQFGVNIREFRGDKVAHETIYVSEGWDAPAWRAPWRTEAAEESTADASGRAATDPAGTPSVVDPEPVA